MTKYKMTGGVHAVHQLLAQNNLHKLYLAENKKSKNVLALAEAAKQAGVPIQIVAGHQIDMMLPGVRHQGIAGESRIQKKLTCWQDAVTGVDCPLILVLDSIQDPHNLGACLRSALAAGVNAVLIPARRAAEITPTVEKVACGAVELLPVFSVNNLRREIEQMKAQGIWIVGGAAGQSRNIYSLNLNVPLALVLGNEGEGIRYGLKEQCDYLAEIPMTETMESLNVSVACGVMLFEIRRQRLFA